jgi:hypothetical protein
LDTYIHTYIDLFASVDAHLWTEPKHKRARLETVAPVPVPPPVKQAVLQQQPVLPKPVATPKNVSYIDFRPGMAVCLCGWSLTSNSLGGGKLRTGQTLVVLLGAVAPYCTDL